MNKSRHWFFVTGCLGMFVALIAEPVQAQQSSNSPVCPQLPSVSLLDADSRLYTLNNMGTGAYQLTCTYHRSDGLGLQVFYNWFEQATASAKREYCNASSIIDFSCTEQGSSCSQSSDRAARVQVRTGGPSIPGGIVETALSYFTEQIEPRAATNPCELAEDDLDNAVSECVAVAARALQEGRLDERRTEPGGIVARVVAIFSAAMIDGCDRRDGEVLTKGMPMFIDDCITTGPRGRVRLQFADRDDERDSGPSVMNIGPNSKVCASSFYTRRTVAEENIGRPIGPNERVSNVELLYGWVRAFFKGFGPNSSFNVKAGVAICGIRGSDGIVYYDPSQQTVKALLNEGHMSVSVPGTGETELLPGEQVDVQDSLIWPKQSFLPSTWNTIVSDLEVPGLENDTVASLTPPGRSGSEDYAAITEEAAAYYTAGDYTRALPLFLQAANGGNNNAQNYLGVMYKQGFGTDSDLSMAAVWFQRAVDSGNMYAPSNLGIMYQEGRPFARDYAKAIELYEIGIQRGDPLAMGSLGYAYQVGLGVPVDLEQALSWFREAANLGSSDAMNRVGIYYEYGRTVTADPAEAAKWYRQAVDAGSDNAKVNLARLYRLGSGVEQNYEEALQLFRDAA